MKTLWLYRPASDDDLHFREFSTKEARRTYLALYIHISLHLLLLTARNYFRLLSRSFSYVIFGQVFNQISTDLYAYVVYVTVLVKRLCRLDGRVDARSRTSFSWFSCIPIDLAVFWSACSFVLVRAIQKPRKALNGRFCVYYVRIFRCSKSSVVFWPRAFQSAHLSRYESRRAQSRFSNDFDVVTSTRQSSNVMKERFSFFRNISKNI